MNWKDVPIPEKMQNLERDKRGLPVPYIVLRSPDGPIFKANDANRVARACKHKLCSICGQKLVKELWYVGGPGSALHPHGVYLDPPMHHECATYALQVCPYLAMSRYTSLKDNVPAPPPGMVYVDYTMDPARPLLFVSVMAYGRTLHTPYQAPLRPYQAIEFWDQGARISSEGARPLIQAAGYDEFLQPVLDAIRA